MLLRQLSYLFIISLSYQAVVFLGTRLEAGGQLSGRVATLHVQGSRFDCQHHKKHSMVTHSTGEAEARGLQVGGQPGLCIERLYLKGRKGKERQSLFPILSQCLHLKGTLAPPCTPSLSLCHLPLLSTFSQTPSMYPFVLLLERDLFPPHTIPNLPHPAWVTGQCSSPPWGSPVSPICYEARVTFDGSRHRCDEVA